MHTAESAYILNSERLICYEPSKILEKFYAGSWTGPTLGKSISPFGPGSGGIALSNSCSQVDRFND
jgi:hypothetical protein